MLPRRSKPLCYYAQTLLGFLGEVGVIIAVSNILCSAYSSTILWTVLHHFHSYTSSPKKPYNLVFSSAKYKETEYTYIEAEQFDHFTINICSGARPTLPHWSKFDILLYFIIGQS